MVYMRLAFASAKMALGGRPLSVRGAARGLGIAKVVVVVTLGFHGLGPWSAVAHAQHDRPLLGPKELYSLHPDHAISADRPIGLLFAEHRPLATDTGGASGELLGAKRHNQWGDSRLHKLYQ